jgi:hypothetical protein
MGRKKTDESEDIEFEKNEPSLDDAEIEAALDSENEIPEEEESDVELEDESPKPKRRSPARKARAKKDPSHPLTTMAKSASEKPEIIEEPETEEDLKAIDVEAVQEAAKPRRRTPRKPKVENEALGWEKQWAALSALSQKVSGQLHTAQTLLSKAPNLGVLPSPHAEVKAITQKPSALTRVAAIASMLALILSLVSLSLSQSARQAALNAQVVSVLPSSTKELSTLEKPQTVGQPLAEVIKNKTSSIFTFEKKPVKPFHPKKAKPEVATAYKPRAPINLYRKKQREKKKESYRGSEAKSPTDD